MGCASSNPLIQGGKQFAETAKESAAEVVTKGENVLHDIGEATKEGIEHVKDAVGATVTTAQASIGNVVEKVGGTISTGTDKHPDTDKDSIPEIIPTQQISKPIEEFVDAVTEAVSESETVLASEIEQQRERISKVEKEATEKWSETVPTDVKENLNDVLQLEDVEETTLDTIENNYKDMKRKAEDLVNKLASPPPSEPAEEAKEEPPFLIRYRQLVYARRHFGRQPPMPFFTRRRYRRCYGSDFPSRRKKTTVSCRGTRRIRYWTCRRVPAIIPTLPESKNDPFPMKGNCSKKNPCARRKSSSTAKIFPSNLTKVKYNDRLLYNVTASM